jgi:hypothetical protein
MNATRGFELYVLMEAAEDDFPMGRWDDFQWHRERPGASPTVDIVARYEQVGWIEVVPVKDTYGTGRMLARARITPSGRKRMDELLRSGVEPEDPLAE